MSGLTVWVPRARLLEALRTNRDGHAAQYEKAKAGYLKVTEKKLADLLKRVADGELVDRVWLDGPPDDHTGDYDDVISMMEWSEQESIELTQSQFKQYVQDDWGWREQWLTSNSVYLPD